MNWKDCFALCLFLMSILANGTLHVVACLHAECKSKPLSCTPQPPATGRQSSYVYNTITSQHRRHNVYNKMWTTRSLFLADVITKTLWRFPDLIRCTSLSCLSCLTVIRYVSTRFLNQKYTPTKRYKIYPRHTADTKASIHHFGTPEQFSTNGTDNIIKYPALMQTSHSRYWRENQRRRR